MSETTAVASLRASRPHPLSDGHAGRRARAAAVSVILHAALVGILCLAVWRLAPTPPRPTSIALVFERPADVPRATIAASHLTAAIAIADKLARTLPVQTTRATEPQHHTLPLRPSPLPQPAIAQAPKLRAAPATPEAPSAAEVAGLKLRIREAVRAAIAYPAVARQMHREGHAQVAFAYVDGAVQNISLVQSSHSGLLDQAALAAVRRAAYPRPPTDLEGVRLALEVWVNFDLQAE